MRFNVPLYSIIAIRVGKSSYAKGYMHGCEVSILGNWHLVKQKGHFSFLMEEKGHLRVSIHSTFY